MVGLTREQKASRQAALQAEQQRQSEAADREAQDRANVLRAKSQLEKTMQTETQTQPPPAARDPRADAMRPGIRTAADRAREIRENRVAADDGSDKFFVNQGEIPDGFTYEWKRASTIGKGDDAYVKSWKRRGYQPVPQDRHPEIMVEQDGMILCEIPTEIRDEMIARDRSTAREAVQTKEQQLAETPEGHFDRTNVPGKMTITRNYQAIPD